MDDGVACTANSSGRRLPSWMVLSQKPVKQDFYNPNNNNNNNDNNLCNTEEENDNRKLIKPQKSRANRKNSKRKLSGDEEEEEGEADSSSSLQLLVRCKERKKMRKRNDNGVDGDGNNVEIPKEKRRRGGQKRKGGEANHGDNLEIPRQNRRRGGRKRMGGKANCDGINSDEEVECIDKDDDLTVEDLISMAEEYVNEYNEGLQMAASLKDDLTVDDLTSIAKEYVKEDTNVKGKYMLKDELTAVREVQDVDVLCADKYKKRLSQKDEVDSQCFLNENVASEAVIVKPTMSGDPTQDMLDLLLGPLLKKPKHEEKKFDVVAEEVCFAYEVQKQKQGVTSGVDTMPLTKKKSSLKDKVAMFLD